MSKLLCIYHADCADGFGAAWAVHRRFDDTVEFVAAKYGDAPPNVVNRDVLIVDFSYPLATLRAMATEARSVLVIDHHKTAQADLAELRPPPDGCGIDRWLGHTETFPSRGSSNLAAIFDMERSGAGLTWDYLHPGRTRPRIIDLIEDRDLWRFNHDPDTRQFHAVAASYGYSMIEKTCGMQNALVFWDILDQWASAPETSASGGLWWSLLREGAAIIRAQQKLVEDTVRGTRRTMRISGFDVPVACCPAALASDAGHVLCTTPMIEHVLWRTEDRDRLGLCRNCGRGEIELDEPCGSEPAFSATYYDGADGRRHFSLRSPPGGADVGEIVKAIAARFNQYTLFREERHRAFWDHAWTGGGHEHVAGFTAPIGWEGDE